MITRTEFVQAIRDFKRKHGGKLKDLLNPETNPETVKVFWANPIIHAYLARPAITFVDKHPQLYDSKTKNEHETTDHYELKLYKYLPDEVFYRKSHITSSKFYTSGTVGDDRHYDVFEKLLKSFSEGLPDINVMRPSEDASAGATMFLDHDGALFPRFHLHANWKGNHASTLLTILDPLTGMALIIFFMNSWQAEGYYEFIKEPFLQRNSIRVGLDQTTATIKNYLHKTFSVNVDSDLLANQPATLLINKDKRAVFTINYPINEYAAIEKLPDIETRLKFLLLMYLIIYSKVMMMQIVCYII